MKKLESFFKSVEQDLWCECGDNNGRNTWNKPLTLNSLLQKNAAVNIFSSPILPLSVALENS